jgi:pimeloyl-ACP methyl ester carboxylesterase
MDVVIFGVSEGGNIAAEVAARIPSITHLMLLGSGGMKGIDEFRLWGKRNGVDFDHFYREVNKYPDSIERKGIGQTYKYWASVLPVDPMESLAALKIPVLAAIGENDEMTPPESVDYLRREFERLDKHNLTVKIFADCNHVLVDSAGVSHRRSLWQTASTWWGY